MNDLSYIFTCKALVVLELERIVLYVRACTWLQVFKTPRDTLD
jgi:hypothetical protein